jgi:hypothetical protein
VTPIPCRLRTRTCKGRARSLKFDFLVARTATVREARLIETPAADLGGKDRLSAGERELVRRA